MTNAPAAAAALLAYTRWSRWGGGEDEPEQTIGLCWALLRRFGTSPYRAAAWWHLGQAAEALERPLTRKADEQVGPSERYADWNGIKRFLKWGVRYQWMRLGSHYAYDREAYRRILADHPDSHLADDAAWALATAPTGGEWEGYPDGPLAQLDAYQGFLNRYPTSPLRREALVEIGHLCRYLQTAYTDTVPDAERAAHWRARALATCREILEKYPGTIEAARAASAIAEIEAGLLIFGGEVEARERDRKAAKE